MKKTIVNYDPNLAYSTGDILQTVNLTFAQWKYRKTIEVAVSGNHLGFSVLKTAISMVYVALPQATDGVAILKMADPENGNTLDNKDDDERGTLWLEDMLISSEITSFSNSCNSNS
ncbi:DUF5406 family protein [Yersinia enterocolitica]|uniref:DUF5406 family protein n=1 Tax=Yersinia TaxID=629 RepID=UPI0005E7E442|nr:MULTISPECIES: DUF5406 family protein [Yersinia]MCW6576425.1 DUF5406 family protein [Yersinia ruckeri]CND59526.1 Uncharacterised protein [Yersinia pseudotuberculosis]CQH79088.1 Uncharacterised protein [Yersinia enterocolitica]HDL7697740.1 DUF5406 family protein [Yersinia enterocolitica]HDL8219575.1 DUF5406 family protein [Yersinia enterocolitica]